MGIEGLLVLAALALLFSGVVALPIAINAQRRARGAEAELRRLDAELRMLRSATGAPPRPPAPQPPPLQSPPLQPQAVQPPAAPKLAPQHSPPIFSPVLPRHPSEDRTRAALIWLRDHWLLVAGALVLQLGIGFLVKYSFERGWIGPPMRVAMGIGAGVLLAAASFHPRVRRIPPLAEALLATGLVSLYFSGFAAQNFYKLVPLEGALAFLAIVSAVTAAIAGARNFMVAGHLAFFGAYLAPPLFATGEDRQVGLFLYVAAVTGGATILVARRGWPGIAAIASLATGVLTFLWFQRFFDPPELTRSLALHAVVIAPLIALPFVRLRFKQGREFDLAHAASTAALAGFFVLRHCGPGERWVLAGQLAFLLAAVYGALALLLRRRFPAESALRQVHEAIALAFLPAAFTGWFDDSPVTLALCAQCAALSWVASRWPSRVALAGALVTGVVGAWRIAVGFPNLAPVAPLSAHIRLLGTALAAILLLYVALGSWAKLRSEGARSVALAGEVVNTILLAIVVLRFTGDVGMRSNLARDVLLAWQAMALGAIGVAVAASGRASSLPVRRVVGACACVGSLAMLIGVAERFHHVASLAPAPLLHLPIALAAGTIALAALAARLFLDESQAPERLMRSVLGLAALLLPLLFLCLEWRRIARREGWSDLSGHAGISILIAAYATGLLLLAVRWRVQRIRVVALALFALLVAKMFLVDLAGLETIWRIVAFVVVGGLLLLAWTLLRPKQEAKEPSAKDA